MSFLYRYRYKMLNILLVFRTKPFLLSEVQKTETCLRQGCMTPPNDGKKEDEEGRKTDDNFAIDVFEFFGGGDTRRFCSSKSRRLQISHSHFFFLSFSLLSAPSLRPSHRTSVGRPITRRFGSNCANERRTRTRSRRRRRPCAFLKVGLKGKKEKKKEMILFFRPQKTRMEEEEGENRSMRRSSRWL